MKVQDLGYIKVKDLISVWMTVAGFFAALLGGVNAFFYKEHAGSPGFIYFTVVALVGAVLLVKGSYNLYTIYKENN